LYAKGRGGLAIPQGSLLPIANGSDTYGLHPSLVEMQGLYNQGKAAVLANVGMLVQPITRAVYLTNNSAVIPSALFSHSDQSSQWQTGIPSGTGNSGWGGRTTDLLQSQNSGLIFPPATATNSCQLFRTGVQTFPATVPPAGMATPNGLSSASANSGMQRLLTFDNGVQLIQAANGIITRGNNYANTLCGLMAGAPALETPFPAGNPRAAQLQTVAKVIAVRNQPGLTRQIFFCLLDGFDTHSLQVETQTPSLQQLSQAAPGGADGSDDAGTRAALIPSTAVDQYGPRWRSGSELRDESPRFFELRHNG
jgi:uncharacterized protein (DUF1501 family)